MKIDPQTVFIANCDKNGYGLMAALGPLGHQVVPCDPRRNCPSFYSRWADPKVLLPSVSLETTAMLDLLIERAQQYDLKPFLVPTNDTYLSVFSDHWERLQDHFQPMFETDPGILLRCQDKASSYQLAQACGVPIPETFPAIEGISSDKYPVILKPTIKNAENFDRIPFRIKVFEQKEELVQAADTFRRASIDFVVQRYIPGEDDQLYSGNTVSIGGDIMALGMGRKIRQYPPTFGVCALAELTSDEKLQDYTERLVESSRITGITQVEFKKYQGEYYLMEINPRPWLWNGLMTHAGLNMAQIFLESYLSGNSQRLYASRSMGTFSTAAKDLRHNVFRHGKVSFWRWLQDYLRADVYSFGSRRDPKPGLVNALLNTPVLNRFFV